MIWFEQFTLKMGEYFLLAFIWIAVLFFVVAFISILSHESKKLFDSHKLKQHKGKR